MSAPSDNPNFSIFYISKLVYYCLLSILDNFFIFFVISYCFFKKMCYYNINSYHLIIFIKLVSPLNPF